jgi:hypothetical protein
VEAGNFYTMCSAGCHSAALRCVQSQLMDPRGIKRALERAEKAIARERNALNVDALSADLAHASAGAMRCR